MTKDRVCANGTDVPRRQFLASLPAVGMMGFATATNAAASVDPHPEWLREWRQARTRWHIAIDEQGEGSAEDMKQWNLRLALGEKIARTPARTPAGARALIQWVLEDAVDQFECYDHKLALERASRALTAFH